MCTQNNYQGLPLLAYMSNRDDDGTVTEAAASVAPDVTASKLAIAKRCSGGPSFDGADGEECVCYGCEKPVHWVKPFERTACGIKHDVQGHFRHNKRAGGCSGGEGLQHKAAKDAILTGMGWEFYAQCTGTRKQVPTDYAHGGFATRDQTFLCDHEIQVDVPQQQKHAELRFQTYFLDVGMLDSSACVVGAVEIFHTSAMKPGKRDALTAAGVAWVEVCAKDVLEVYEAHGRGGRVRAVDFSVMQCDACVLRQKSIDALAREQRVMQEIERERLARVAQERARALRVGENAEAARQAKCAIETQGPQALAERLAEGSESLCVEEEVSMPATFWSEVVTTTAQILGMDLGQINAQRESNMARAVVAKQALLEASKAAGSTVLSFGKHRGTTVALLFNDEDTKNYVRWLSGYTGYKDEDSNRPEVHWDTSAYEFVPPAVAEEAKQLLKGRCLLCFCGTDQEWKSWCAGCFRKACRG